MAESPPTLAVTGRVARITLNRPAQANRLGPDDLAALAAHIDVVDKSDVLVLQLTGRGKHFCSGYDLGQFAARTEKSAFEEVVNKLEDCRPVTIAAINGGVYGGATDLALACDFRIGVEATRMFMPAARLGLHFYQRGLERYVSRLGLDMAKRIFLTCEEFHSEQLLACGFLSECVARDVLDERVAALSEHLAGMAPIPLLGMKRHLNAIARNALQVEALNADIHLAAKSSDLAEGARAWAEKRRPNFTGQ
ncbi:enoyl-CoA hydratase/isomerase family protein [Paraburkholderia bannensis]|uniref:enoyl-CoA hydratase/isomerase family protein n=1 Tax=Paraburkholderia bannensis TaxID=765414 RepID=UPI002AB07821|nr:enoyl-CoA hydratase/isomerase family protein [Paraburkholderia bannensis]